MTVDDIAKIIAENMPSPYALDIVWSQTPGKPTFDLSQDEGAAEEWRDMARAVLRALGQ